jgi:phosphate/sulfate permease
MLKALTICWLISGAFWLFCINWLGFNCGTIMTLLTAVIGIVLLVILEHNSTEEKE